MGAEIDDLRRHLHAVDLCVQAIAEIESSEARTEMCGELLSACGKLCDVASDICGCKRRPPSLAASGTDSIPPPE